MEHKNKTITTALLRSWLEQGKPVVVLDVRPMEQRNEWAIPGSIYIDAYEKLKEKQPDALNNLSLPEGIPIVTVCAAGKTSLIASEILLQKGYEAFSLEDGMKGWSLSWNVAETKDGELTIIQVRRTGKGCLSYMVASGSEAVVIDASVDIEVYQNLAKKRGWDLKYILDTHIHADHISRSPELAKATKAALYLPHQDKVKFEFNKLVGGDVLTFGNTKLEVLHTPGHTLDSLSYSLHNKYLFTGDTLFTDGVGRPDLKADEEQARHRASVLYASLRKIARLDPQTIVFPGHTSKPVSFDQVIIGATIAEIQAKVQALRLSEEEFVKNILSKIPPTPPNYLKITEMNLEGILDGIDFKEVEAGANRCAVS